MTAPDPTEALDRRSAAVRQASLSDPTAFDLAIIGAGPIGLYTALRLARDWPDRSKILLIDAGPGGTAARDPRVVALSEGTRLRLSRLGAWPKEAMRINSIHVSQHGSFGRTTMDRADVGVDALGHVASYGAIVAALEARLPDSGVTVLRPCDARVARARPGEAVIHAGARRFVPRVVIHAEGGIFGDADGPRAGQTEVQDYGQYGLVARVRTDRPVSADAFERFTDDGPLALLPTTTGWCAIWCANRAITEQRLQMPEREFLHTLQQAFSRGSTRDIGEFIHLDHRVSFPLGMRWDPTLVRPPEVAVGNAAQTLHPVAGQGMNLGFRDADDLCEAMLLHPHAPEQVLRQHARRRQADRWMVRGVTNVLATGFTAAPWPMKQARSLLLAAMDLTPTVNRQFARLMAFGLPR